MTGPHARRDDAAGAAAAALSVRRILPGEEAVWFAVRPSRRSPPPAFTAEPGFRSEAHLVAVRDGAPVGRMESILEEPHEVTLVHPIATDGASPDEFAQVVDALVAEGVSVAAALGTARTQLLLMDSMSRLDELMERTARWGFTLEQRKAFYSVDAASVRWDLASPPSGLSFRSARDADDPELVTTLARVLDGSYESDQDAAADVALYVALCRRNDCLHPEDWEFATLDDGRVVGVVLPAFADAGHAAGTNLHVGLVPEARGRGLGLALHARGLATMRRRGATRFISSCDVRNVPMQRVFERLGYTRRSAQFVYTLRGAPTP